MNYCTVCGKETRYITCPTCQKYEKIYLKTEVCLNNEDINKLRSGSYTMDYDLVVVRDNLGDVLDTLTLKEEKLIRLRFGFDDGICKTLEEAGKEFNATRERIRQIEAKALRKLRHPSRNRKIREFFGLNPWTDKEITTWLVNKAEEDKKIMEMEKIRKERIEKAKILKEKMEKIRKERIA